MYYDVNGNDISSSAVYGRSGSSLSQIYDIFGTPLIIESDDYNTYSTEYQKAILDARNQWATQYRSDTSNIIPLVLHTDQHGRFSTGNAYYKPTAALFQYLGLAVKWNEASALVGLGDVDLSQAMYANYAAVLNTAVGKEKRIDLWGNHDLWKNYTTDEETGQFIVDFDTVYPTFNNETYGDESHAYNHKGIEYHIDAVHGVKYVCLAGWEIDKNLGGYSHYVIGSDSMDGIIDMLEMKDGYDIVLLSHLQPWGNMKKAYSQSPGGTNGSDIFYDEPKERSDLGGVVVYGSILATMLADRNAYRAGTVKDSYGNDHAYDFTNCTGKILCGFNGHSHLDMFGWSNADVLQICLDAFAYGTRPFYFVNVDKLREQVTLWKVTTNALVQSYTVPFHSSSMDATTYLSVGTKGCGSILQVKSDGTMLSAGDGDDSATLTYGGATAEMLDLTEVIYDA